MPNWKLQGSALVEDAGAPDPDPVEPEEVTDGFDPGEHTVDEVKDYVDANPDEAQDVLDAELDGKNRVTLVEWLTDDGS